MSEAEELSPRPMVTYECADGVATLTLNDPDRRNSLSPEMITDLVEALIRYDTDPETRCAIITGAGTAFCAGGNPSRMIAPGGSYVDKSPAELMNFYKRGIHRIPLTLQALTKPIIAAVNGPAIGAGCDLASYCDMRIASTAASFATSFVKLGLIPADGGAWILPRLIGVARANEMLLSGETITAQTAAEWGYVNRIAEPDALLDVSRRLARSVARNPQHAVQMAKRLIAGSAQTDLGNALNMAASFQAAAHKTDDHIEAVRAFLERRRPVFTGK